MNHVQISSKFVPKIIIPYAAFEQVIFKIMKKPGDMLYLCPFATF